MEYITKNNRKAIKVGDKTFFYKSKADKVVAERKAKAYEVLNPQKPKRKKKKEQ